MALETAADRLAFVEIDGVTVTAPGGEFTGLFDNGYASALADPAVEGASPQVMARTSDVDAASVAKGQSLTISGSTYRVHRLEHDGTGMTTVVLKA